MSSRFKRNAQWLGPALVSVVCIGTLLSRGAEGSAPRMDWIGWSYAGMALASSLVAGIVLLGRAGSRKEV